MLLLLLTLGPAATCQASPWLLASPSAALAFVGPSEQCDWEEEGTIGLQVLVPGCVAQSLSACSREETRATSQWRLPSQ